MAEITPIEKRLIGLSPEDDIPSGGITYEIYSFDGFRADSTKSWSNASNSLNVTLRNAFGGIEFYPGSLNVRLKSGEPWHAPDELNPRPIQLGVFREAYALPVVLNEKCVAIACANNVRGFDPATEERLLPPPEVDPCEIYQIYSPACIRHRLQHYDNSVPISARLLSGHLITPVTERIQVSKLEI